MSGIICLNDETGVALLTDGATYDQDGVITKLGRKVTVSKTVPFAMTTRGNGIIGEKHQRMTCDLADRIGVDAAIQAFRDTVATLDDIKATSEAGMMQWHIAAWSETRGPVQFSAHNIASDGEEPFRLHEKSGVYYSGNLLVPNNDLAAVGIRPRTPGETIAAYAEDVGVAMMEAMRRHPAVLFDSQESDGQPQYIIGGQCDLTVITESGALMKTVKTWPDRVGERINPFAEEEGANVVPMLNRQQRRALKAEQARQAKRA